MHSRKNEKYGKDLEAAGKHCKDGDIAFIRTGWLGVRRRVHESNYLMTMRFNGLKLKARMFI
jgi:hypothetical protein